MPEGIKEMLKRIRIIILQKASKFHLYLSWNNDVTMNAKEICIGVTTGIQFLHFTASGNNLKVNTISH